MDDPIAFQAYSTLYAEAEVLQNQNRFEEAIKVHQKIFRKYVPSGSAYYDSAASCYMILGQFDRAEEIYNIALNNPEAFNESTWRAIKKNFVSAIKNCKSLKSAYPKVLSAIQSEPGILQKDLKNVLPEVPVDLIATIVEWLLRNGAIAKSKQGRYISLHPKY